MSKTNEVEAAPQESSTPQTPGIDPPELASLMQVREILTGPLATDVEHRIAEMDQRLESTLTEFTATSATRMDAIEESYKSELGKLNDELGEQRVQYQDRVERLERELSLGLEQMRGNIQDVTDQLATTAETLRAELGQDFEAIRGTVQELFEKVTNQFDEEKLRLRNELVDRDTLSAALSEVAIRLAPPSGETHEIDPEEHEMELDQILENATSGTA